MSDVVGLFAFLLLEFGLEWGQHPVHTHLCILNKWDKGRQASVESI